MEARARIAIALLLVGCTQPQISEGNSEPIVAVSTVAPRPARQQRDTPRRLKLRLTLDRPEDLKVKVGDSVSKGQVISDRTSTRTSLIKEREVLQQQLKQLQSQTVTPNYAVEQAEVEQARLKVEQARVAIANFHADSPWTDYARQVLPIAESTQLGELEAEYEQARGELAMAIAKLQKAQQPVAGNLFTCNQQNSLLKQIHKIEARLESLGVVRAPYSGRLRSIKWLRQNNQALQVELTLSMT